ncbi:MAG: bifunctional glutamate N-acetyltransferase/amino-acid acetyltransferase ArgJ [Rhodospirillales bacterium]|nr:MAG: bifunctional glutamate N-acetyltransferase/amino-acid acetyltransferase ArgJ [Rhodospirillales bacterium]
MATPPRSPLAPARFPDIPAIGGVRSATAAAGVRYRGRDDVLLVELAPGTHAAGVLTRSATATAEVQWCRRALRNGGATGARALVVNAGNANAFTGPHGEAAVAVVVRDAAALVGCPETSVFRAATGVIGERLPADRITGVLASLHDGLRPGNWDAAARAIMTTDTFPKGAVRTTTIDGAPVTVAGIAKGSGMIAPDMATMLAFVFTDAGIAADALQAMLKQAVARSFNSITVDSDTSTSDTLLLFATGAAGHAAVTDAADPRAEAFRTALQAVCTDLAQQVVRDGEGASKFVTVQVTGAADDAAAKRIALSIANSPLVKTAVAGADANWGRIVMAVGKSGERVDRDRLAIRIGGVAVAAAGDVVPGYDEAPVARHMQGQEISIEVDIGLGSGGWVVWTCDLTHGYIDINASYRS